MAGRGAAPGERRGGRRKGEPNKATIERALIAEKNLIDAKVNGKKLAKEVLEEFMFTFAGMAAYYQPLPDNQPAPIGRKPNEAKFEKWARLACDQAKELAKYQSPTFRAVQVTASQPLPTGPGGKQIDGEVIKLDQISISRVYRQIVGGGK
jgi:hypothetical protein